MSGASAVASSGHPFDWHVRSLNALLPTPVTDLGPTNRVAASFDVVWIGDGQFDIQVVECVELSRTCKDAVDGMAAAMRLHAVGMAGESVADPKSRHVVVNTAGPSTAEDTVSLGTSSAKDKLAVISQVVRDDRLKERRDSAACCSESGGTSNYLGPSSLGVQISLSTVRDKTGVMEKMSGVPALASSTVTRRGRVEGASKGNKFKWAFSMNNWNESIDDSCTLRLLPSSWTSQENYNRLILPEPDFGEFLLDEFISSGDESDVATRQGRMKGVLKVVEPAQALVNQLMDWNRLMSDLGSLWSLPSSSGSEEDYNGFSVLPELDFGRSLLDEFWSSVDKGKNDSTECRLETAERKITENAGSFKPCVNSTDWNVKPCVIRLSAVGVSQSRADRNEVIPGSRRSLSRGSRGSGNAHNRGKGALSFKRERSEIPEGGYFRARTEPPGSPQESLFTDGGSDSSSSESSSDESVVERRRKAKAARKRNVSQKGQQKRKKALASIKIKKPFVYKGKADLDIFDQWTYQVDNWAELHDLDDAIMVKIMVNFMGGRASQFFMKHVALSRRKWTVKLVYEGLFDYCFPPNFKWQLREELMRATQGLSSVRDFV
ncbi:hypothetical protein GGX14DRAFT_618637 [Mycena pura]|uniref:Uncharacterized protein n=1 Tax=Mycena pura TaxID=153505 RepID=A0AAD6YCD6_9AGAR|nr:hypothetical protein GGX14DRAFT_618637 [Mycena pura]